MNWLDSSSIITKKKTQSINDKWIRITLAYWSVDNKNFSQQIIAYVHAKLNQRRWQ